MSKGWKSGQIRCPDCGHDGLSVVNSRKLTDETGIDFVYRRRECPQCAGRFTTLETFVGKDAPTRIRTPNAEIAAAREKLGAAAYAIAEAWEALNALVTS